MNLTLPYPPSANRYLSTNSQAIWYNEGMDEQIPTSPGIYMITNTANGYFYVGSARNLRKRWADHRSYLKKQRHHNPHLQAAWNKYGAGAFAFSVLEVVPDLGGLLVAEQRWLDHYQAAIRRDCYNFLPTAGSHLGRKRSAETRARLSAANTGKKHSDEAKAKMRAAKLGRTLTAEHKAKVAATSTGRKYIRTEEWKAQYRKLSVEQVREFRQLRAAGWSLPRLAAYFGIGFSTAQRIASGESYQGVGTL